jgi:DNA-binding GntR family transcriptional regulator
MAPDLDTLIAEAQETHRSTTDAVAQALREAILRGMYTAGQPLRQDELAARFGMSKIPVREALRKLEAEGLVAFYPNRGAVMTQLSPDEAEEIGEIRIALEGAALRRAVAHMTPRELRRAQDVLDESRDESDSARWSALNWEFHAALYAPANRPQLLKLIQQMHRRVDRYMRITLAGAGHQAQSLREHRLLLQAVKHGDAQAAETILVEHIRTGTARLTAYLKSVMNAA